MLVAEPSNIVTFSFVCNLLFPLKSKVKIFVLLVFLCIWQILFFTIVLTLIPKLFWGSRVQIGLLFTGIAVDRHSVFVFLSCAQSLSSFFSAFHLPQFFVLSYLLWFVFTFLFLLPYVFHLLTLILVVFGEGVEINTCVQSRTAYLHISPMVCYWA